MFRPYFAIVKDSFNAALATRSLIVLFLLITILLGALLPLGTEERLSWKIRGDNDVPNPASMVDRLVEDGASGRDVLVVEVWKNLPHDLQVDLQKLHDADVERGRKGDSGPEKLGDTIGKVKIWERLFDEINNMIQKRDFYNEEVWSKAVLGSEAQELVDQGIDSLEDIQVWRLNRLLIGGIALGGVVRQSPASSIQIKYAKWELGSVPMTQAGFQSIVTSNLPYVFDKTLMSIGIFIAIVVTASIIPDMFHEGSLNLLLSKPVSRWILLLFKYLGGCAFISLCAIYLFAGIWLIMGWRFSIWEPAILYSIPVYIFVFAMYYAVSVFLGILFRSPIVSIIGTLMFWAVCFVLGYFNNCFVAYEERRQITHVVEMGDEVFQINATQLAHKWNPKNSKWEPSFVGEEEAMVAQVFYGMSFFPIPMPPLPGNKTMAVEPQTNVLMRQPLDFQNPQANRTLTVTNKDRKWKPAVIPATGRSFRKSLVDPQYGLVAVTDRGQFFAINPDAIKQALDSTNSQAADDNQKESTTPVSANTDDDTKAKSDASDDKKIEPLRALGPDRRIAIGSDRLIDLNVSNHEIAIYRNSTISFLGRKSADEEFEVLDQIDVQTGVDSSMTAMISYQGNHVVLALGNSQIISISRRPLEEQNGYRPESVSAIHSIAGSPDGRWFAVSYRNGKVWMLDTSKPAQMFLPSIAEQGEVGLIKFNANNELVVVTRWNSIIHRDPESLKENRRLSASPNQLEIAYRYGVRILHASFPKPGEFYKLVSHLAVGGSRETMDDVDLTRRAEPRNPWSPLWSGMGFTLVVLALACLVFQRSDY